MSEPRKVRSSTSHAQSAMSNTADITERLSRIEKLLAALISQRAIKDWYTTTEVAGILDRAEWTVREWCRTGRVNAEKRPCGRGNSQEWIISHDELQRIRN